MSFATQQDADARLCILKALAEQRPDNRLGDRMLVRHLDAWGHRRSIDYVRTQLRKLVEVGGITLPVDSAAAMIAEITVAGREHVHRRGVLEGVRQPDPGEE